jgi:hypothetical protein
MVIMEHPIKTSWLNLSLSCSIWFYTLDGPELKPGRGDSPNTCKLVLGSIKPPLTQVKGGLLGSKVAGAWKTTQIHLMLKFRLSGITLQTPNFCAFIAGKAQLFLFYHFSTVSIVPYLLHLTWWERLKDKTWLRNWGSRFLQNNDTNLQNVTASQPRKESPVWQPQNSDIEHVWPSDST